MLQFLSDTFMDYCILHADYLLAMFEWIENFVVDENTFWLILSHMYSYDINFTRADCAGGDV